jgi:hypothetical protein
MKPTKLDEVEFIKRPTINSLKDVAKKLNSGDRQYFFDYSMLQFEGEETEFNATISDELKERCFLFF